MENKLNILLAEDDDNLGLLLHTFLSSKGYNVKLARNGKLALEHFNSEKVDFCILDVMMPIMDGIATAKEIRELNRQVPILFLTAKSLEEDKLAGFAVGADDYLTKPFSMEELIARIEAISRRTSTKTNATDSKTSIGSISFDTQTRILHLPSGDVKLTTKENQLLNLLTKNTNEIIDRQATLRAIWGDDNYFNGRSMDVYIAKLRKLLKEDPTIEIMNIHGKGFQLIVK
jgi:two-component system, OmpR family, response regulator